MDRIEAWAHAHPRTATALFFLYMLAAMLVCGTMDYNA